MNQNYDKPYKVFEICCIDYLEDCYKKYNNEKIVLWGTGSLGKLRLKLFRKYGMTDNVVAFCNTFHNSLLEVSIDGCRELSPYQALEKYPDAIFIISSDFYDDIISFIKKNMPTTIRWIIFDQDEIRIEKQLLYYYICEPSSSIVGFNNSWFDIYDNFEIMGGNYLDYILSILEDNKSRYVIKNRVMGIKTGKLSYFLDIPIDYNQYYSNEYFEICSNEVYLDCGAYNGDTIAEFIKFTNKKYKKILAFEPDVNNFKKLVRLINEQNLSCVETICAATGSYNGEIGFSGYGSMTSKLNYSEKINCVPIVKLDNYMDYCPTFIKMDIEGAELDTIRGAQKIIQTFKPKLAVCIYHNPIDFYLIPLTLKQLVPDYKFKIRQHQFGFFDLVLYAFV